MSAVRLHVTGPVSGPGSPRWTLTVERAEDVEIHRTLEGDMRVTFLMPTRTIEHTMFGPDGTDYTPAREQLQRAEFLMDETIDVVISPVASAGDQPLVQWRQP